MSIVKEELISTMMRHYYEVLKALDTVSDRTGVEPEFIDDWEIEQHLRDEV